MTSFRLDPPRQLRWLLGALMVLGLVAPVAALSAPKTSDSGCGKCYTFSIVQTNSAGPTADAVFKGTIVNTSDPGPGHQLGAVDITWTPTNAFYQVTAGSVSVSPAGTVTPSETADTSAVHLRNLDASPGATVTFTFHARFLRGEKVTFSSAAKQSNDFNGIGNDLTQTSANPSIQLPAGCGGSIAFNAYGCQGVQISVGGTVCTGTVDDSGAPSKATACITLPPVPGASGVQLISLRTYLGNEGCPISPVDCTWTTQLMTKLDPAYDLAHSATITTDCTTICGTAALYFQQNEATGITEPLLPCLPVSPIASPISGSDVCEQTDSSGHVVALHVTSNNDYKVMGIAVG